ncbi:hypothetical protein V8E53_013742 [Lactarius tabidus]
MSKASDSKDVVIHVSEKGAATSPSWLSTVLTHSAVCIGGDYPYESASEKVSPKTLPKNPTLAEEEDRRTAEGWKEEAERVFLVTGLFSAVVKSFILMSIQDIQANPQDTSNFYLASIHQALTGSNLSNISLPSSPPTFTPPTYGIWINSRWFLS